MDKIFSKVKENIEGLIDRKFINDDFMLTNEYARELYHESAEKMPPLARPVKASVESIDTMALRSAKIASPFSRTTLKSGSIEPEIVI